MPKRRPPIAEGEPTWLAHQALNPTVFVVRGKRVSLRLDRLHLRCLEDIARAEGVTAREIVEVVDLRRGDGGLTAAVRIFVLAYWREAAMAMGNRRPSIQDLLENGIGT